MASRAQDWVTCEKGSRLTLWLLFSYVVQPQEKLILVFSVWLTHADTHMQTNATEDSAKISTCAFFGALHVVRTECPLWSGNPGKGKEEWESSGALLDYTWGGLMSTTSQILGFAASFIGPIY